MTDPTFDELEKMSEDFFDTRDYLPSSELELDEDDLPLVGDEEETEEL